MAKSRITAKRSRRAPPPMPTPPPAEPPLVPSLDVTAGDLPVHRSHLPAGMIMVGVGASAGGLEAFTELLQSAPTGAGLTFVFVQHLSPHHTSALPALLAAHTAMPVVEVLNGVRVEPNHVYVIPPNVQMVLTGETLQLTPRVEDRRAPTPIDGFFLSMAEIACDRGVGIVLSGTGSDGAVGLRDLKACGGITFAQLPESAKFDGMPRAAIATGMVDLVMTPAQIGAELKQIAAHPYVDTAATDHPPDTGDEHLRRIFELLRPASGVDFSHYKQPTIRRRLLRRMALHRLNDVSQYVRLLQSDPQELQGLFQDLLIHVTRFFREPDSFTALAEQVFPKLVERREPDHPIRAWVCGCATGEEAYSLAIELVDYLQRQHSHVGAQIFATDVSEAAIEHARAGVYASSIAADVPADRLRRFFTRHDGHYRVNKQIRDLCVFARQDLTRDPPFSRLDIVMCRNVLIYMDSVLQRKLIGLFHYALTPNSYLVLGQAESVGAQASLFALIDKKHRIHRKKTLPGTAAVMMQAAGHFSTLAAPRRPATSGMMDGQSSLQGEVSRIILDRYTPPGVVVDADLQIVQFRGQTGLFLEPAPGDASLSLLKMLREGLLYGVRSAIDEVRRTRNTVRREDLQVRIDRRWARVSVEVVPLTAAGNAHYLVLFERTDRGDGTSGKTRAGAKTTTAEKGRSAKEAPARLTSLQRELDASRQYLQSIIQELEAANEELQSANEEILSSNEELQSTNEELDTAKEELQSTNEELNTVNDELQGRNDELSRVNSDLINLVGSVHIAIVIVGNDLRIRRFTAMAEKVLNLIPADLNRSIAHINPDIDCPNLSQLIVECMDTITPLERDVRDKRGRWFSLRIRPYKSTDNRIDGAVLALFDIDALKRSEQTTQRAQAFAEALLEESSEPVALLDRDFTITKANSAFARLFKSRPADLGGSAIDEIGGAAWRLDEWREDAARFIPGKALPPLTVQRRDGPIVVNARAVPAPDSPDTTLLMVSVTNGTA
jgi:two-component system CheB/CheR fusion protein